MLLPAKFYACGKCRYSAVVCPLQNTLTFRFSYGSKDLDNHFAHCPFCTETVLQEPDGDPLFVTILNKKYAIE